MNRIQSVDVLRVAAIISVIIIHTVPPGNSIASIGDNVDFRALVDLPTQFAVPFFFIISGYFWAQKCESHKEISGPSIFMLKRIAFLFIGWSAIYLLPTNLFDEAVYGPVGIVKRVYWNLESVLANPLQFIMQGTSSHLWFLAALFWCIGLSAILLQYGRVWLFLLSATLYFIGLAGKAYSESPLGFQIDFNLRNGPFFSLIFFVTGYFLHRKKPDPRWLRFGLAVAAFGLLLQFLELLALKQQWGTNLARDYGIGTYFLGLGAGLVGLSNSPYLNFPRTASIGPLVLGIYASHVIFVDLLSPLNRYFQGIWIWPFLYIGMVFVLSYVLSRLMANFWLTRKLVM